MAAWRESLHRRLRPWEEGSGVKRREVNKRRAKRTTPEAERAQSHRFLVAALVPVFICVLFPIVRVGNVVGRHSRFSPIDEVAHWDYIQRLSIGEFPRMGDRLRAETLREAACRGVALPEMVLPPCGARTLFPDDFPGRAYQYEAQQPPLYYALSIPLSLLTGDLFGLGPVRGTRLTGAFWLATALLLTWRTGRILGVARTSLSAAILLVASAPVVTYHASVVSNDAMVLFGGALVCYAAARVHVGTEHVTWLATVSGVVAAMVKTTCLIPCVILGSLLLWAGRPWTAREPAATSAEASRRYRRGGLGLILGALLPTAIWVGLSRSLATIPLEQIPAFDVLQGKPVNLLVIAREALLVLSPLTDAYTPFAAPFPNTYRVLAILLRVLVLGTALTGCLVWAKRGWWHDVGPVVVAGLYLGGVVLGIGIWRAYQVDPGLFGAIWPRCGPGADARSRGSLPESGGSAVAAAR